MRVIAMQLVDPNIGLRHSVPIVCAERLCRIQAWDSGQMAPRLINAPLVGSPPPDAEAVALGEAFEIGGQTGAFRIERLSGEAGALVLNRVS